MKAVVAVAVCCIAYGSLALAPWVTDEEREFVKHRVTKVDSIPGTPEGDAKRFYKNRELTEYVEFNYDESKTGDGTYTLEDPLSFSDGRKLKDASEWPARRKEILALFEREVYGRMPPAPEALVSEMLSEKLTEDRFTIERRYRIWFRSDKTGPFIDWLVHIPKYAKKPCPVILHLNYKGNDFLAKEGRTNHYILPFGQITARGYAFMSAQYTQITSDAKEKPEADPFNGVCELWGMRDPKRTDNPGAMMVWAWGLCRGLDLAERIPEMDAKRNVVIGSSRLGKAALLAAAYDERFAVCVPNQTGGGGAPLAKRDYGENTSTENAMFTHWYCKAYRKYAEKPWESLTFDQHLLLAAVAPRALLIEGFDTSRWMHTKGEYLACRAAAPVWAFLGRGTMPDVPYPDNYSTAGIGESFGYVRRSEQHGISAHDWMWMLDFADREFKRR